jgi:membrane protease YdiL (CAAX protease family)
MASESKSFISTPLGQAASAGISIHPATRAFDFSNLIEVGLVFGLILIAVWTPLGTVNTVVTLAATFLTVTLTFRGHYSAEQMGLAQPFSGAMVIFGLGASFVLLIAGLGTFTRFLGSPQALPWNRAWQYAIWALVQQFILQSFMYVRLESVFGSRRAVLVASGLFALAHLPSPLLTLLSFMGALFFCEMFRRYRDIFPLGLVHAALGLTIAASLPDHILHHMRVGIGYLMYRV